jgi:hypothetical protein
MGPYELSLPLLTASMQMFPFTKYKVVVRPCFERRYFTKFIDVKSLLTLLNLIFNNIFLFYN